VRAYIINHTEWQVRNIQIRRAKVKNKRALLKDQMSYRLVEGYGILGVPLRQIRKGKVKKKNIYIKNKRYSVSPSQAPIMFNILRRRTSHLTIIHFKLNE